MTQLSAHFTLEEAIASQTAARLGITNDPPLEAVMNMKQAALGMEQVRMLLGGLPITVSSWYRCPELNKAVGSKPTSAHVSGFAVDFICPRFGSVDDIVKAIVGSNLQFDQVIKEFATNGGGWCHIAFNGMRKQALVIDAQGTREYASA